MWSFVIIWQWNLDMRVMHAFGSSVNILWSHSMLFHLWNYNCFSAKPNWFILSFLLPFVHYAWDHLKCMFVYISHECVLSCFSSVWLFVTPWTIVYQASQSMEFSWQEYWSGLPCPSPGDLPDPGIKAASPTLQVDCLPTEPPGKPVYLLIFLRIFCNLDFQIILK